MEIRWTEMILRRKSCDDDNNHNHVCTPSSQCTQTPHYSITCFATHEISYYIILQNGISSSYYILPYSLFAMIMATQRCGGRAGSRRKWDVETRPTKKYEFNSRKNGLRFFSSLKMNHKNKKEAFFLIPFGVPFFSFLALSCQKRFFY